ncbi:MAG: peptidoglycan-binding domain-containing protein [Hyphomicrobiaceae bacterium]|nr:hypothetical protein [Hyphomicrobiaceae bacterium]
MGKATGAFLILAGIGTAALVLPSVDKDAERQLADVVRIATGASNASAPAPIAASAVKATSTAPRVGSLPFPVVTPPPVPAARPSQAAPSNPIATATIATSVAAPSKINPVITAPTAPIVGEASRVDTNDSRAATLTRDIQRELKRVGCYDGEVSGDWNTGTRKAMKTFIDRVNATLPTDAPDHILKTLVQGHPGNACGTTCPSGQSLASNGRCLPSAILAQRDGSFVKKRIATAQEPIVKPQAPRNEANLAAKSETPVIRSAEASSWTTTTNAVPQPVPAPLPGRMAIGAPRADSPNTQVMISPPLTSNAWSKSKQIAAINSDDNTQPTTKQSAPAISSDADEGEPKTTIKKSSTSASPAPRAAAASQPRERRASPPFAVYRAAPPPPQIRYVAPSWQAPARRFGPQIFSEQARWAR